MTDPNVKMVNVQVETGSTEHALLTGAKKTRRRRNLASTSSPTPSPDVSTVTPPSDNTKNAVKVMKAGEASQSLSPPEPGAEPVPALPLGPPQPLKITASPPVTPESAVKIAPKTGHAPPTPVPRLLPKKRIGAAPAAETLKQKPKFVVEVGATSGNPENSLKGGTSAPEAPTSGTNRSTVVAVGGVRSRTRRSFKERRISLTVQPVKKSRKYRRTLRARVAEMPLQQVRRLLLRKGVLKPKTGADAEKAPPEEMMRSMLVDYMMLHHVD